MRVIVDLVVNHTSIKHPWFRAAERQRRLAVPRLLRLARRPAAGHEEARSSSPTRRRASGAVGEDGGVVPAPLLQAAARPQRHQPAGARRDRQGHGLLAAARASTASASTPSRSCWRPRASTQPRPPVPRPARLPAGAARAGRPAGRATAILLGEVNLPYEQQLQFFGGPDGDELTMQFDFITHAGALPVAGPRATPARWSRRSPPGRRCRRTRSGRRSCATTTSSPSTS